MGFFQLLANLPQERLSIAIGAVAGAEAALQLSLDYGKDREAFGRPIGRFQHNRFQLAEAKTEVDIGRVFVDRLIEGGALKASLVLGVIWAVWHLPFFVFMMPDPVILLAQLLTLVGARVLLAWIFNNTGKSIFATIVFHAVDNAALVTMPEIQAISPWGAVVHCGLVLVAASVVTLLWGPRTLARFRFAN